jgi:hypothetical protein
MFMRPSTVRLPRIGKILLAVLSTWAVLAVALCGVLLYFRPADGGLLNVVYGTLGIYCSLWQLYFGLDAVLAENEFQFAACHVSSLLFTAFIFFNVFHNASALGPVWDAPVGRYSVLAVAVAYQSVILALARPVWRSFGFFAYKVRRAAVNV